MSCSPELVSDLTRHAAALRTAIGFVSPPLVEDTDERAGAAARRLRHALLVAENLRERLVSRRGL